MAGGKKKHKKRSKDKGKEKGTSGSAGVATKDDGRPKRKRKRVRTFFSPPLCFCLFDVSRFALP